MRLIDRVKQFFTPGESLDEAALLVSIPIEKEFNTPAMRTRREALRRARYNEATNRYLWRDCQ